MTLREARSKLRWALRDRGVAIRCEYQGRTATGGKIYRWTLGAFEGAAA